ncbi:hypothetical protein [Rubrivivax albus]|uniref:Uncharacterized protein n=1 Tax=Rubrivivax albus TaxID=2499835 RepID=A0A437JNF6_9BURK|nr:hypothetical protein [Rubrivivax albus]RVT48381.1 hypothetical protein ENE75_22050 [Rubrivivax albus]
MSTTNPAPFGDKIEGNYLVGGGKGQPSALQFNPDASLQSLMAAAQWRADSLSKSLNQWARANDDGVLAWEVASALEPWAQEIETILEQLDSRIRALSSVSDQ